jgi:ferredoxin/cytochrome c2
MSFESTEAGEADQTVRLPGAFRSLERWTMRAESPLGRLVRSQRLNPLPHAGTISVFLLAVVVLTGIYLTLFFEFGFEDSYRAVAKLEAHPIQRAVRGVHRFASAALVLTTLVHAWRTFVMQRFTGPRRWRWATGVFALFVVWLAGVTGYWLIWDRRAQALNEATGLLLAPVWPSLEVGIASPSGSGWPWLLGIWTAHLLLTGVVGWALWRHLRRTRHRWLPPRRWMWAMFGALTAASIVFPAGMLPPADPAVIPGELPLDPFVMFLLPPLLSPWRWLAVMAGASVGFLAGGLPWLLGRRPPPVATVIEAACTGCALCVVDCPYLAIEMVARDDDHKVALVDAARCVGCGICVGSCAFDAIGGFGSAPFARSEVEGRVALVCSRQARFGPAAGVDSVIEVRCTGMLAPRTVGALAERGAFSVQVVGCPPGDCAYGVGNLLTSERLAGVRPPLLPPRFRGAVTQDWVNPADLERALAGPGSHPRADLDSAPEDRRTMVPAVLVVLVSVVAIRFATDAPFRPAPPEAVVRVVVDHVPGSSLVGQAEPSSGPMLLEVAADAVAIASVRFEAAERLLDVIDVELPSEARRVQVTFTEGSVATVLFAGSVDLGADQRLIVAARDEPPAPGILAGQELFEGAGLGANLGCDICHSVQPGVRRVGPSLAGIGDSAASRVPGLTAEEYLRQSILEPDAYIVEGYRAGQMLPVYGERLEERQIEELIAYLMSLRETGS